MRVKTITFEDDGQDFLEWDVVHSRRSDKSIERGVYIVVDSRPYQKDVWKGVYVKQLKVKHRPLVFLKMQGDAKRYEFVTLNYRITKISSWH